MNNQGKTLQGVLLPIYEVTTEGDVEGRTTKRLGYVTGEIKDIKDYFEEEKAYSLQIRQIGPIKHIAPSDVANKQALLRRKAELEIELKRINDHLK